MDGYKTFVDGSGKHSHSKSKDGGSGSQCCGSGSQCCSSDDKMDDASFKTSVLFDKKSFIPLDATQDSIFPAKLKVMLKNKFKCSREGEKEGKNCARK